MAKKTDFIDSNQRKIKNPLSSFHKTVSSFRDFKVLFGTVKKRKVQQTRLFTGLFGGELGIRTLGPFRDTAFRVLCRKGSHRTGRVRAGQFVPGFSAVSSRFRGAKARKMAWVQVKPASAVLAPFGKIFWKNARFHAR